MKCNKCKYLWHMLPSMDSPYGEFACMKTETDLYGSQAEDVADCKDFESLPKALDPTEQARAEG